MTKRDRLSIVGAGAMGTSIATLCAAYGYRVALTDTNIESLKRFPERATPIAKYLAGTSRTTNDILRNVESFDSLEESIKGSFMVHEAIHEDLEAKRELFQKLEELCEPNTILATNTSSFLLSAISEKLTSQHRMIGIHYVAPAHLIRAVEILTARFTDEDVIAQAKVFVESIDHVGIVCRETPGFIINRIQYALKAEVMKILEQGIASVEDIDAAVRLAIGPRLALWGPLMQEDMSASKNTVISVSDYIYNATGNVHFKPPAILKKLANAGNLGATAGAGWYKWEIDGALLTAERDSQLGELLEWLRAHDRRMALGVKGANPLIARVEHSEGDAAELS
jgi:3-hydroxybutyryl-CoA dehydrogenase